jgi:microcystin-dependent protein
MPPSPRLGIPVPVQTDPPDGPNQLDAIVDILDGAALDLQGTLAARPAAHTVPRGTFYWATDTEQQSRSDGVAWHDIGAAGLVIGDYKFSAQAADHSGWLLCDGRTNVPRADHPADFVALMLALGYAGVDGTTFGVPDFRGRVPVGVGTHADVNSPGDTEGEAAVANRRPRHRHAVTDVVSNAAHLAAAGGGSHYAYGAFDASEFSPGQAQGITAPGATDVTVEVGPQASSPTDSPAYIAFHWFVYTGAAGPGGGGGAGGAGLAARELAEFATANIASGEHDTGSLALAPSIRLLRVAADAACRVRLYSTAADRDSATEAERPVATPPVGDHGVIADVELEAGALSLRLSPQALGSNYDDPVADDIYWRVTNLSGGAAVVNVDLDWQALEPAAA